MASNPNPQRISAACWWFWEEFDKVEPTVALGGVYASKPGYHNYRRALPGYDYSVGHVSTDRADVGEYAAAIDLTMSDAAMKKYSARLHNACANRDPRLFIGGEAIIREYIGTLTGSQVSCYVVVGGRALGLANDSGPDWGRDETHLWHIHISVIRKYVASLEAWRRILSIMKGETSAAYFGRGAANSTTTQGEIDAMAESQFQVLSDKIETLISMLRDAKSPPGQAQTLPNGQHRLAIFRDLEELEALVKATQTAVAEIQPVASAPVDPAAVKAAVAAALADPAVVSALVKAVNDDAARRAAE